MKDLVVTTYMIYLPIAILLTFFVARVFFKNSKIFMLDIFNGRKEIAGSTNTLFETGFYLLSLGFALFYMRIRYVNVAKFNFQDLFETLSYKVGMLAVFLGCMVFFNLYMLFRGKKKTVINKLRKERAAAIIPEPNQG